MNHDWFSEIVAFFIAFVNTFLEIIRYEYKNMFVWDQNKIGNPIV